MFGGKKIIFRGQNNRFFLGCLFIPGLCKGAGKPHFHFFFVKITTVGGHKNGTLVRPFPGQCFFLSSAVLLILDKVSGPGQSYSADEKNRCSIFMATPVPIFITLSGTARGQEF